MFLKIICKQNSPPPYAAEEGKKYITDNLLNFMLLTKKNLKYSLMTTAESFHSVIFLLFLKIKK